MIESLDLVITVDMIVAHAAGALIPPAWILLPSCTAIDDYLIGMTHPISQVREYLVNPNLTTEIVYYGK